MAIPIPDEDAIAFLMRALGADRTVAIRLVAEGHTSVEEVAYVPFAELLETGIDEALLTEVRKRAREYLSQQ